jgi:hypothetical protein
VTSERWVLLISSVLMWIPCVLLLVVGAPLWVGGILAVSAGTMTVQAVGTTDGKGRFTRWAARAFRS